MNAPITTYLAELLDNAKVNTGYAYALQKCTTVVRRAKSPLDPANVRLLKLFGEGQVSQRIQGHFAKDEFSSQLPSRHQSELDRRVHQELDRALASGQLDGKQISRAVQRRIEETKSGLKTFLVLEDIRDIGLLKSCTAEILHHLQTAFPVVRKRKAVMSSRIARIPVKRRRGDTSAFDASAISATPPPSSGACSSPLSGPKPPRACQPLTGGWAIMVGLHLAGSAQKKDELVKLSVEHGLCREPLVRPQQTVSRQGQWYDAWSSMTRLRKVGWVLCRGSKYSLTDAGMQEASRYAQQWAQANKLSEGAQTDASARNSVPLEKDVTISSERDASRPSFTVGLRSASSRCCAIDLSSSDGEEIPGNIGQACFRVLVDLAEKQTIRECLSKTLPSCLQMNIPGVDYAFGQAHGEDFRLGKVLVERKTVHDYLATLSSERGELQAGVQKSLRDAGFSVVIILEGIHELRQHPQHKEILMSAHGSETPVFTTASIHDTAIMLDALAANAQAHDGWTLNSMQDLIQHHYDVDDASVCGAVLVALGVDEPFAQAVACRYGSVSALLQEILFSITDDELSVETVAQRVGTKVGITTYQASKLLRTLGMEDAMLCRNGGLQRNVALMSRKRERKCWKAGVLIEQKRHVEVGRDFPKPLARCLREFVEEIKVNESLAADCLQVCCGTSRYPFRIGNGSELDPGAHWLIIGTEIDWQSITRRRAEAYACHGVISTLCATKDQLAQHVAARAAAFLQQSSSKSFVSAHRTSQARGLQGVLRWARTAGGLIPAPVAQNLATKVQHLGGLVPLASKVRAEGMDYLLSLGVRDFGIERADAVRALLLGGA